MLAERSMSMMTSRSEASESESLRYGRANRSASSSTPVARKASNSQRRTLRRRAESLSTERSKKRVPIFTCRARGRNSRWIMIGTAIAAAPARKPRCIKPRPAKLHSQSEKLRSFRQVIKQSLLDRSVGRHQHPIDRPAPQAVVQLALPRRERLLVKRHGSRRSGSSIPRPSRGRESEPGPLTDRACSSGSSR